MANVQVYLTFPGNCEEAFDHYKSVFGGDFSYVGKFRDMPPQEGAEMSDEDLNKIMHISLPIGEGTTLMGSDSGGEWAPGLIVGNNISVSVTTDTNEQADHIFNGLAEGGKVTMPIGAQFWTAYFGMCTDRFGINWMVGIKDGQPA